MIALTQAQTQAGFRELCAAIDTSDQLEWAARTGDAAAAYAAMHSASVQLLSATQRSTAPPSLLLPATAAAAAGGCRGHVKHEQAATAAPKTIRPPQCSDCCPANNYTGGEGLGVALRAAAVAWWGRSVRCAVNLLEREGRHADALHYLEIALQVS